MGREVRSVLLLLIAILLVICLVEAPALIDSSQWGWNLTAMGNGAIALGDLNNDNLTDLILTGDINGAAGPYAKIYINNGTSLNENISWQWNLTPIYRSSLTLGDIDNDGNLDLGLVGWNGASYFAKIYTNNGTSFNDNLTWGWNLTAGERSTILFADINNDARLDLIVGNPKFRVYLNNGTSFNENINWAKNVQDSLSTGSGTGKTEAIDLGDYDNDGDLDLILAGHDGGDPRNKLFKNNGTSFILDTSYNGINYCDVSFGDINNDGNLDLVEIGAFFEDPEAYILINENSTLSVNTSWAKGISSMNGGLALVDYNNDGKLDLSWGGNSIAKLYNNTGLNFSEDSVNYPPLKRRAFTDD